MSLDTEKAKKSLTTEIVLNRIVNVSESVSFCDKFV